MSARVFTQAQQRAGHPQNVAQQSGQHESTTQHVTIFNLKWVHHGDVFVVPHWLGKEEPT